MQFKLQGGTNSLLGHCRTMQPAPRLFLKKQFCQRLVGEIETIKHEGLFKEEVVLASPQRSTVKVVGRGDEPTTMINFCANNYLGLADHPGGPDAEMGTGSFYLLEMRKAGREMLKRRGVGMSSVRFICGTQDIHKDLERKLARFHSKDDAILYTSCFDANAGLFETILGPDDAVLSDAINHASIIDGIRLCKAQRLRYKHNDMVDLERLLSEHRGKARTMLIATDGVFSMDGDLADLPRIGELAEKYDAVLFVDDSHATGFLGARGRGTAEHFGLEGKVDIISSTLGKALGGASGGYIAGPSAIISILRQRSRPYLFSNSLPPVVVAFADKALDMVESMPELRMRVMANARYFRESMARCGYKLMGNGNHPICPVLVGDAMSAERMARDLREKGILVTSFSYPVVPQGLARIRVQLSAAHTQAQIDRAVGEFARAGKAQGLL